MIKRYPPFNDFITSSLCVGLGFVGVVITPLSFFYEWSISITVLACVVILVLAIVGMYFILFVNYSVTIKSTFFLLPISLPIAILSAFPELLISPIQSPLFETDRTRYFNAWFALIITSIGFFWSYLDSHIQLKKYREQPIDPLCLMTFNIYISDHSFEPKEVTRGMRTLIIPIATVGVLMFFLFLLPNTSRDTHGLYMIIGKVAMMLTAGIFFAHISVFLGQAAHLLSLERQAGKALRLLALEQRLKWRHDYVKYHLPWPLRKLNLRLFNQHVEAYEQLQAQVKTSRI